MPVTRTRISPDYVKGTCPNVCRPTCGPTITRTRITGDYFNPFRGGFFNTYRPHTYCPIVVPPAHPVIVNPTIVPPVHPVIVDSSPVASSCADAVCLAFLITAGLVCLVMAASTSYTPLVSPNMPYTSPICHTEEVCNFLDICHLENVCIH